MTVTDKKKSLSLPPGNNGLPFIGELLELIKDPYFAQKRHEKYGAIFRTKLLDQNVIYLRGTEANNFLFSNEKEYFETQLFKTTEALLGKSSISVQTGPIHQSRRKILYQAFQPRLLSNNINEIENIARRYFENWKNIKILTWYPELKKFTFDVACKFLIGLEKASDTQLGDWYEAWEPGLFSFNTLPLPWTNFSRAMRSRKKLLNEIEKIILDRQKQNDFNSDALGILLNAQDENGNKLNLEEIKNQIIALLFAGHTTLTSALSSLCLLLAQHEHVLTRLRTEQEKFPRDEPLTLEMLKKMNYLEQVLQEVLRLIPPVAAGFRKIIKTCEFNNYQLPEGWMIFYSIASTHQDLRVYFEPGRFDPERFSPKRNESKNKPYSYIPFGAGMRECLGKELARLEMKIFAALLVREYEWKLIPSQNLNLNFVPVPRPIDGLKVYFNQRL
ncbi:MAG: cytochrome P450 [Prochloraceae cyanobacterium]|nr:cytochrome P450 [Prochloraceae cyanobacterium]